MSATVGLLVLLSANPLGVNAGTIAVTAANPAQLTSFEWLDIQSPQRAGDTFDISIRAKDENGNDYDYDGNAFLSTSLGSYVYPNVVQFNNGVCDTGVIVTLSESLSLRCSTGTPSGESNLFEVLAGEPKRLIAILPGEQPAPGVAGGRSGWPDSQTAGDTFTLAVYLTDEWFNRIGLRNDSVYFASDDRFAQVPRGGALSNGTGSFSVSLRAAGKSHIFTSPVVGSSLRADTSSAATVFPGPFEQMLLRAPGETLAPGDTAQLGWETPGKVGTPSPQLLQTPFAVTIYPCDRCWNRVDGPGDTVFLRSDFPFEFLPSGVELRDSAVFDSVQFHAPGPNQNIWAVDQVTGKESYATHLTIRALGATLEVTAPDTVRSGETTDVLVRVLDANGNPIVATLVRSSVVKGNGTILEPALLTDTLGFTTARFLCTPSPASEQDSIRVSSGDADTVFGIYVTHLSDSLFAFPNPFGSVNCDRTEIFYSLDRASSVRVTIYDPFGNEVWRRRFGPDEPGGRAGDNTIWWDGKDSRGQRVASGIYVIQVLGILNTGIEPWGTYRIGVVW